MPLQYSQHAFERMAERGITDVDLETALLQSIGAPAPGQPGSVVIQGYAPGGRILKVCVRASDREYVITAYWR